MMMRILRSDTVVKLANRLLRTYSPGLLSGSMLMGIMAGGPFSPWGQLTGGMGALLYPFPTGEAAETTQESSGWKTVLQSQGLASQAQDRINRRSITEFPNMDIKFPTCRTFLRETLQRAPACPGFCTFFPSATVNRVCTEKPAAGVFISQQRCHYPLSVAKISCMWPSFSQCYDVAHVQLRMAWLRPKNPSNTSYILPQRYTLLIPDTHWINIVKNSKQTSH